MIRGKQIRVIGEDKCQTKYHRDFPKISSNFDKQNTPQKSNAQTSHQKLLENNPPKSHQTSQQEKIPEPAPYTVVQTLAAKLRHIHVAQEPTIVLKTPPKQTTKQGQPASSLTCMTLFTLKLWIVIILWWGSSV